MAAEKARERNNSEEYEHSDLNKGTIHKSSLSKSAPEEVWGPEDDPFLSSPSQRRSADGFPPLSGSDRKCGRGSALASDFWSQGVANLRALNSRSIGNEKISDSTIIIEESSTLGTSSARKDNPTSARTQSKGNSDRSRILASWPFEGAPAPSSVEDCLARPTDAAACALDDTPEHKKPAPSSVEDFLVRPTLDVAASALDDTPEHKKPSLLSAHGNPVTFLAPGMRACDRSSELHVQESRSTTSESVQDCLIKSHGGNKFDSPMGADAVSSHVQRSRDETTSHAEIEVENLGQSTTAETQPARSTVASRPENGHELEGLLATVQSKPGRNTIKSNKEIENNLLDLPITTKTRPAMLRGSTPGSGAHSSLEGGSSHQQRQNLHIPREPKAMRESKESSNAVHRSFTHVTPTRSAEIRHQKSLIATPGSGAHSSLEGGSSHQQRQNLHIPREPKAMRESKESSNAVHRSFTHVTPIQSAKTRHQKSLSAEASAFQPHQPAHSSATPTRSHSNGHVKSASTGTGCAEHNFASSLPNWQLGLWPYGPNNTGPPLAPDGSGAFTNSGEAQPSIGFGYPEPHQHTPDGQGQFFGTRGSMTPLMYPQSHGPLDPTLHSLHAPLPVFRNDIIYCNAQIGKQGEQNAEYSQSNHFDSYTTAQAPNAAPNAADLHQNGNLYAQDTNGYGPRYYSNHADPSHQVTSCEHRVSHTMLRKLQLNQSLYSPLEPHREPSKPNQRTSKDMFIPEDIRLKLHAKTEATLRVFAGKGPID